MRFLFPCLVAVPLALAQAGNPALAQVSTNDDALNALKPAAPAPGTNTTGTNTAGTDSAGTSAGPAHAASVARAGVKRVVHRPVRPAAHVAKPAVPPQVPAAPPANPVIPPPAFVMPAHPRPNPPPVPVKADAVGTVTPIAGGSELTFGPGAASLNQKTHDAILAVAAQAKANPLLQISVTAWAPGTPDDPSTPRTLALERALAARAVLINAGIVSNRILAVSKGFDGIAGGPPDRLDIVAAAPKTTPSAVRR